MRVTSWNCLCGDVSDRLLDLAPRRSDLITLQECRRPASDSASVIWRGTDNRTTARGPSRRWSCWSSRGAIRVSITPWSPGPWG